MKTDKLDLKKLKPHPLGSLFPPMGDIEYAALKKSIKTNGFDPKHPIVLLDGMIIDGNHRYTAAQAAKIIPPFIDFKGDDAFSFVVQENLTRRNLTPSQASTVAANLLEQSKAAEKAAKEAEKAAKKASGDKSKPAKGQKAPPKGRKAAKVAKALGVSPRSVASATALKKADPKKFAQVQAGTTTLHAATEEVKTKQTKQEREEEEFQQAIAVIAKVGGESLAKLAVEKLSNGEVLRLSGLEENEMLRIRPLIEAGWKVKDALSYKSTQMTKAHTIRHLLDHAIAQGGTCEIDFDTHLVSVKPKV